MLDLISQQGGNSPLSPLVFTSIIFAFACVGFAVSAWKIGTLQQQIKTEQSECGRKIAVLEMKIQSLREQLIDILRENQIKGVNLNIDAGGDVDIDGVGNGVSRNRPITRGL